MEPLSKATDPGSDRLSESQAISINRAHLAGTSWDLIAADHGTTRKNISRIVQGVRWRHVHPVARPDLYNLVRAGEVDTTIPDALAEIEHQLRIIRASLQNAH